MNVTGKTDSFATVTINGEALTADGDGNFYKVIGVKGRVAIISVTAQAPSKSKTQFILVLYVDSSNFFI